MLKARTILLALSTNFLVGSASNAFADVSNVYVKIIAFNDLHGHLKPPRLSLFLRTKNSLGTYLPAGGAAYLASAIKSLKQANPFHAVVSAGDLIGASPLVSALFLDEPLSKQSTPST